MTDSSIPTGDTGGSLQRELRRDLAIARLQLTITQALCAYIDETNADERVRLTDVEFVHNGAKVSVRMRVGEAAIAEAVVRKDEAAIVEQFRIMQALAAMEETCKAGCQCGRESKRERDIAEAESILRQDLGKMESQMLSGDWKPNSMYTSREDQERYGQGDGRGDENVAAA